MPIKIPKNMIVQEAAIMVNCPSCGKGTPLGEAMSVDAHYEDSGCDTCGGEASATVEVYCRNPECGKLLMKRGYQ